MSFWNRLALIAAARELMYMDDNFNHGRWWPFVANVGLIALFLWTSAPAKTRGESR